MTSVTLIMPIDKGHRVARISVDILRRYLARDGYPGTQQRPVGGAYRALLAYGGCDVPGGYCRASFPRADSIRASNARYLAMVSRVTSNMSPSFH